MPTLALRTTALPFCGMALRAFGFAAFVFAAPACDMAGRAMRKASCLRLSVILTAVAGSASPWPRDPPAAAPPALIAATRPPARQAPTPAIDAATVAGARTRRRGPHGLSVAITAGSFCLAGPVPARFGDMAPP